jgi:hypothetical protein
MNLKQKFQLLFILLFSLTENVFLLPCGSGTTIRHKTQTPHITENTPRSKKKEQKKLHAQQRTHYIQ